MTSSELDLASTARALERIAAALEDLYDLLAREESTPTIYKLKEANR